MPSCATRLEKALSLREVHEDAERCALLESVRLSGPLRCTRIDMFESITDGTRRRILQPSRRVRHREYHKAQLLLVELPRECRP